MMFCCWWYCRYVYESKEEYDAEIPAIAEVLSPLVLKCRDLGRAMRIGTNHGE
jgi:(E)-4-hydroxy-3-methylbut-2-enyl-diphosphate synthase